jgi:hypothetical protein
VRASAAQLPAAPARARPAPAAPVDVPAELARLSGLLRASDSAAQEQFELLRPALSQHLAADALDRLARAMQVFDFDAAVAILDTLPPAADAAPSEVHPAAKRG